MDSTTKKEKRIESKKRKAKAFLELVKESDEVKKNSDDSNHENSAAKTPKLCLEQKQNEKQFKSIDELAEFRKLMRERQKASMEKPKIYLLLDDLQFQHSRQMSEDLTYKELPPLFMLDLQHLLLYATQGNVSSFKPRWCRLLRVGKVTSVVVLVLDSVSSYELQMYPDCFPRLKAEFDLCADMVSPEQYGSTVHEDLFNVPLSNADLLKINGSLSQQTRTTLTQMTRPPGYKAPEITSKKKNKKEEGSDNKTDDKVSLETGFSNAAVIHKDDAFDRTSLLLNSTQMVAEDFPMPINYGKSDTYKSFVFTRDSYSTVNSQSPMFAVDCEMCITVAKKYELTRVSVVNEDLETVYDTYVKPYNQITDYVTRYSGITRAILNPVKTRLCDVQKFLKDVLPSDAILCGQSLKGDLIALQMFHPYVIDTSVIFNLSGQRMFKTSLKKLSAHFLGKVIQDSMEGHSSVEDAITTMELVKLKLKQSPNFGDIVNGGELFPKTDENKDTNYPGGDSQPGLQSDNILNTIPSDKNSTSSPSSKADITGKSIADVTNTGKADDSNLKAADDSNQECTCGESKSDSNLKCEKCGKNSSQKPMNIGPELIQQRKAFFNKAGSQVYENFFNLMKKHNKIVGLIDKSETLDLYKDDSVTTVPTKCDRDSKSTGKSLVQFHDFVYMHFPSYRDVLDSSSEEERMNILRKQDKRMSKVLKHVRNNSLVAIVMSGRCHQGQNYGAKTFVKVT